MQAISNNIEHNNDEFAKVVTELEALVLDLQQEGDEHPDGPQMVKISSKVDDKIAQIKKVKKFYGLELRLVKDRAQRSFYDDLGKEYDKRVLVATQTAASYQEKLKKKELFGNSDSSANATGKNQYDTEGKNNDELLSGANKIQDMTFESLARTRNLIEASKEVGTSTLEELSRQRDQIKDIDQEVTNIDNRLTRAEKLVINFTRRMASDRLIQLCSAINIVIMIALCLYVGITGKKFTDAKSRNNAGPQNNFNSTALPTLNPSFRR